MNEGHTYVVLQIYPGDMSPEWVTETLGIAPSSVRVKGEEITNSLGRTRQAPKTGWFLSSEDRIASDDARPHVDWLLQKVVPKADLLSEMRATGTKAYVRLVWWSKGHGGPTLSPSQLKGLADLGLEIDFDVYFDDRDLPTSTS